MKDYQRRQSFQAPRNFITLRTQIPWFNMSFWEITEKQVHGFLNQQWSSILEVFSI